MTARVLDGRAIAKDIASEVRHEVSAFERSGGTPPALVVVRVGDDPASVRYAVQLQRAFSGVGLAARVDAIPETIDDTGLERHLRALGDDGSVNGILLQFPLPSHLLVERAVEAIHPLKDVDGVNPANAGRLLSGRGRHFAPATPLGGLELLHRSRVTVVGAHAVVVGRSEIVGKPLALLLLRRHATVTICHSRTLDLARYTLQAEILAVAVGRPGLIVGDMVAPGAAVIDFGMNVVDGTLVGDVDAASVEPIAGALSPTPGGTGPMTNAMLMLNLLAAARWQREAGRHPDENVAQS